MQQNKDLIRYHQEIQQWQNAGSVLVEFNRSKIKSFYNENSIRLNTCFEKIDKLRMEFLELDEKNQIKWSGEGQDKKPIFKEGKTQEEFDKLYNAIMDGEIQIKF